ncbi:MAG: type II toxin-antitoxin system VapC family toxin [bacterium]|nr:type II toxin-antitoxin system VapC family toxin [bacterium]
MAQRRVLIDTGAIYAFVTRSDRNHSAARSFVERWLKRRGVFVLTDSVFAETMTLLKVRLGAQVAIRVGRELRDNPAYAWTTLGSDGEREAWEIFRKYDDKDWSYTDCSLLAVSRRSGVRGIFAFDRHFSQMDGVERLPE